MCSGAPGPWFRIGTEEDTIDYSTTTGDDDVDARLVKTYYQRVDPQGC